MLTVGDIMTTNVLTVSEREALKFADAEMKLGSFRHLPVVDDNQHVVGMLSDRDLLRAVRRHAASMPVGEIMTRRVYVVRTNTPAHKAVSLMLEHKIGALPVIGEGEVVVGIVTETDFLAIARDALLGKSLRD